MIGIYPVWRLLAETKSWSEVGAPLQITAAIIGLTSLLLWLLRFALVEEMPKRAIVVSAFFFCFYLFSPITFFNLGTQILGPHTAHRLLTVSGARIVSLLGTAVILLWASLSVRRSVSSFTLFTTVASTFMGVLLLLTTGEVVTDYLASRQNAAVTPPWLSAAETIRENALRQEVRPSPGRPDIYYIVVDGYARSDVLSRYYGLDNGDFLRKLRDRGFQVVDQSQSNYVQTFFSLASTLNMNYLDSLQSALGRESSDRHPLQYLIQNNAVAELLKRAGYKYVLVASSYLLNTARGAMVDLCLCDSETGGLFGQMLLERTILGLWTTEFNYARHARGIQESLGHLQEVPAAETPQFVFAHVLAPHPPFVFNEDGSLRENTKPFGLFDGSHYQGSQIDYVAGYRAQITYLNGELLKTIDVILARSRTPPIIVLQADHGPGSMLDWESSEHTNMNERLPILNALHLPGNQRAVDPTLTPVNIFRTIFDHYLDTGYGVLENRSFYGTWTRPYAWEPIVLEEDGHDLPERHRPIVRTSREPSGI